MSFNNGVGTPNLVHHFLYSECLLSEVPLYAGHRALKDVELMELIFFHTPLKDLLTSVMAKRSRPYRELEHDFKRKKAARVLRDDFNIKISEANRLISLDLSRENILKLYHRSSSDVKFEEALQSSGVRSESLRRTLSEQMYCYSYR